MKMEIVFLTISTLLIKHFRDRKGDGGCDERIIAYRLLGNSLQIGL
jgi:hypothetical protein